jgi:hypothetical protein
MAVKIKILPNRLKTEGDFYKESRKLLEKGLFKNFKIYIIKDNHTF